jgi:Holliday junction DNA helicase RuvB
MAEAISLEYGSDLHTIQCGSDTKPAEICAVLRDVRHGDIVFADEAHSLSRDAQQIFHLAIDQWRIPVATARGIDRSAFESVAQFSLVMATDMPGSIRRALRSRLTRIEFDPYSQKELRAIARRIAGNEGVSLSPQAATLLAQTAQGSPRAIQGRVRGLRDYWPNAQDFHRNHVRGFLESEGVDKHGLTPHQRQYLRCLAAMPDGQCNLEQMAVRLGCDALNVRQEVEPFLIDEGFVDPRSRVGRRITENGRRVVLEFD